MEPLIVSALGLAFVAVVSFFILARRRSSTATESDSDDETSGPLTVNVVADHDEQDSLLPKFASLLRSPWNSVAPGKKEQPKMMRPVRKESRSMSLTIPLPLRKKRKPAEIPIKKVHVPYFFPLMDETVEWWQSQQFMGGEPQPTPEQEPETGSGRNSGEHDLLSGSLSKGEGYVSGVSVKELVPNQFAAVEIAGKPIEVGG